MRKEVGATHRAVLYDMPILTTSLDHLCNIQLFDAGFERVCRSEAQRDGLAIDIL